MNYRTNVIFCTPVTFSKLTIYDFCFNPEDIRHCSTYHYWEATGGLMVTHHTKESYQKQKNSHGHNDYLLKIVFYLPVENSDFIEAEQINAPF